MSDMTDMAIGFFKGVLVFIIVVSIIFILGFFTGKKIGHDKGIKECNNETIKKQLGY